MFKFVPHAARHAWWPVQWQAATEDGEPVTNRIEMRFWLPDDAEYQTLVTQTSSEFDARWRELEGEARETEQRKARAGYADLFVKAWRGIEDETGQPVYWDANSEFVQAFLQLGGVMDAVLVAHAAARRGARPNG